jgi:hypothetical protein
MTNVKSLVRDTWCFKFLNTKPGKYVKFFILLILDMINVIVDWYFYTKVQLIKPGNFKNFTIFNILVFDLYYNCF